MIDMALYHKIHSRQPHGSVHEFLSDEDPITDQQSVDGYEQDVHGLAGFPWREFPDSPELLVFPRVTRAYDLGSNKWGEKLPNHRKQLCTRRIYTARC